MVEDNIHASAFGAGTFDLEATDGTVTGRGIIITPTSLRWNSEECSFEDIVAVELLCDASEDLIASCSIIRKGESRLIIELTGVPRGEPTIYRNFVRSLVEELGPAHRARIAFRPALAPARFGRMGRTAGRQHWYDGLGTRHQQIAAAPENKYIIPVVGMLIPLFALALWKSPHRPEPKPIDPEKLEGFLPPAYYK